MLALAAPPRCPRCERALELDERDVDGRRARCGHCGTGCDILSLRSPDDGPLRTFEHLQLVSDDRRPPAHMEDLSGGGRTRHVRLWAIRPDGSWLRVSVAVGVLAASILFMLAMTLAAVGGIAWLCQLLGVMVALLMFRREATALRGREDIWLARGRLHRRRSGLGIGWTRSVKLSRLIDVELSPGVGTGPFLEVRLRGGRRLRLAEDFSQGEEALRWLRDHLRAGIATVRDDRGVRPGQDDGTTARAQLTAPSPAKES